MLHADQHMMMPTTPAAPAAMVRSVGITDLTYVPQSLVVAPGAQITWHNDGRNRHTATSDDGTSWASPPLLPGDHFTASAPAVPGVYRYHCIYHSYIRGTVTVTLLSLTAPASVLAGGQPMLAGNAPDVAAGTAVTIEQRVAGAWQAIGQDATDDQGAFEVVGPAISVRTAFRAVIGEAVSPSVRAEVRPAVVVRRHGARVTVRVRPAGGRMADLQQLSLDTYRWRTVATARLMGGHARFTLRAPGVYRAMSEPGHGISAGVSRVLLFEKKAFIE